jgi:hypothetical protein
MDLRNYFENTKGDQEKIKSLRRRNLPDECYEGKTQHLVHFRIDGVRTLIGTEE